MRDLQRDVLEAVQKALTAYPDRTFGEILIEATDRPNPYYVSDNELVQKLTAMTPAANENQPNDFAAELVELIAAGWTYYPDTDLGAYLASLVHHHGIYNFADLSDEALVTWLSEATERASA